MYENNTFTATVTNKATGDTDTRAIRNDQDFNEFYAAEVMRFPVYEDALWFMEQLAKAAKSVVSGEMIENGFSMLPTPDAEAVIEYNFKADVAFTLDTPFADLIATMRKLPMEQAQSVEREVRSTINRTRQFVERGSESFSNLDSMQAANARGFHINIEKGDIKTALEDAMIYQALKPLIAMAEAKAEAARQYQIVQMRFLNKFDR